MKVLIADDNADHVLTLSMLLECEGFEVRSALQAQEIVPLVESFRPHVCLLDIGMPGCDGYETARKLRAKFGGESTLMAVTAYASTADRQKAREAGFDLHIAKPFMPSDLIEVLAGLAAKHKLAV